ncbi:MAG: DUF6162 family protein [Hydrogenophaga sp.]
MRSTQVVRPAGAGHETLWVMLAAAAVLAVAAIVIGVRAEPSANAALAAHQVDARTQLNAAEQGVHADLLVAAEEITALSEADRALPRVEQLREMDLPPFAAGAVAAARGAHEWRIAAQGRDMGYVGRSAAPEVAASFLLRFSLKPPSPAQEAHDHEDHVEVWVLRDQWQTWPDHLDSASLTRLGWREVVVRYDAGVTRKDAAR